MKHCLAFFLYTTIFAVFTVLIPCTETYAHHKKDVLGEATSASQLNFPPVTAGPGFILPDNPFFFLDQAMQNLKIALAFSPEEKARVRAEIAGERMAELRIMMARDNELGIERALSSLRQEVTVASSHLATAQASGKQVIPLAKDLNATIKQQREILGTLESQANGVLKRQLQTTREALKIAKVSVEDALPEDELKNEIQENLEEEIEEQIHETTGSATEFAHAIDVLTRLASQAAEKEETTRLEAIRLAIASKNEAYQREQERLMQLEMRKRESIEEVRKRASEEAKQTIREAQEAAKRFSDAQKQTRELRSKPASEFQLTPTIPTRNTTLRTSSNQ